MICHELGAQYSERRRRDLAVQKTVVDLDCPALTRRDHPLNRLSVPKDSGSTAFINHVPSLGIVFRFIFDIADRIVRCVFKSNLPAGDGAEPAATPVRL
jgi:hypothetical protein